MKELLGHRKLSTPRGLRRNTRRDPPLSEGQFDVALHRLNVLRRHREVVKAMDDDAVEDVNQRAVGLMIRQRAPGSHPIQAVAEALPLATSAVDAALAILSPSTELPSRSVEPC